ncbi:polymer-forming cytoskeletal protein [Flammeovirga pectinis]|uniref:Polymer-forming cytoskeletal protein n=1 Tax=Flammeovirga pectinis TaxID=2494373 RepID=A0A3Q9FL49_9BACT|nr:polymer-forming cytoskeletal protein [Flammeovirga pectinis]AZQ60709.1 polymer-forming cytoskeletal protein [Flammeovirga pectinis]
MGLFGNNEDKITPTQQPSNVTNNTIGQGTTLRGDVETHGILRMDGKLIGNLHCHSKLFLGTEGQVEGDIFAQNAEIEGEIHGKIEVADNLVLRASAVVHGDIITKKLTIDPGAIFNGQCHMGESRPLLAPSDNSSEAEKVEDNETTEAE